MATYSVIGAGSSSNNPVTVFAGCETSVNICWIGRKTISPNEGYCTECYYIDEQYCSTITGVTSNTTGTITWEGNTVHYDIKKNCIPEPTPPVCDTTICSDFSLYTVPKYIPSDYYDTIDIHYLYTLTSKSSSGDICGIENLSGVEEKHISAFTSGDSVYTYDFKLSDYPSTCGGMAKVFITNEEGCESGLTVDVSMLFNPQEVPALPASGTDVTTTVLLRKVLIDEDCNRVATTASSSYTWHVSCSTNCCSDHIVYGRLPISSITEMIDDDGAKIRYNGHFYSEDDPEYSAITYSIIQKAKYTDECSGGSEHEDTKYCVDNNSVKVYYETGYMSNEWVETGTLPYEGGRIKVTWNYSACTTNDCSEYDSAYTGNTWEEIIEVPSCDDRDGGEGECSYTTGESGSTTGNCVIYFKKWSGCGISGKPYDYSDEVYNVIDYSFKQNCYTTPCEEIVDIVYDKKTVVVTSGNTSATTKVVVLGNESRPLVTGDTRPECFTGTIPSFQVSYTKSIENKDGVCHAHADETGVTGTTPFTITEDDVNNSSGDRIVYDDEMYTIIQSGVTGPCKTDELCAMTVKLSNENLALGDSAIIKFVEGTNEDSYSIRGGEEVSYYTAAESVIAEFSSNPDNRNNYYYKKTGTDIVISSTALNCNDEIEITAVKGCSENWGTGHASKDNVPASGGRYTLTATDIPYSAATCEVTVISGTCEVDVPQNHSTAGTSYTGVVDAKIGGETHGKIEYTITQVGAEPVECGCERFYFYGTEEPDPTPIPTTISINVNAQNLTSQHIQFIALQIVYQDTSLGTDEISFGAGMEISPSQSIDDGPFTIPIGHEGNTVSSVRVSYNLGGGETINRGLNSDEWRFTSGREFSNEDTLYIQFKS